MFESLLERIALTLEQAHIPYMIIGGQAVLLYGEPRGRPATRSRRRPPRSNPKSKADLAYIRQWLREFSDSLGESFLTTFDHLAGGLE
jgi:hypothetical protein